LGSNSNDKSKEAFEVKRLDNGNTNWHKYTQRQALSCMMYYL